MAPPTIIIGSECRRIQLLFVITCIGTLASISQAISSNCFYLPNIALNGGTYDEFNAAEIKHCCIACARDACCIAYTYDMEKGRCYMKAAISDSYKHTKMTSGLKANTHEGQGAFLRNVKIQGGTASAVVNLPNTEDCMQYCTAYGIYSWSPLPATATTTTGGSNSGTTTAAADKFSEDGNNALVATGQQQHNHHNHQHHHRHHQQQQHGQCSCMSRISSLEYSFGSKSAIFPPVSNLN